MAGQDLDGLDHRILRSISGQFRWSSRREERAPSVETWFGSRDLAALALDQLMIRLVTGGALEHRRRVSERG